MTVQTIAPVQKAITVKLPQRQAFEVFTSKMGTWWNPARRIADEPFVDIVVEPGVGGSWHEVDAAGPDLLVA